MFTPEQNGLEVSPAAEDLTPAGDTARYLATATQHLRVAIQSLWHARTKPPATREVSAFLEPLQTNLQLEMERLESARKFLDERERL